MSESSDTDSSHAASDFDRVLTEHEDRSVICPGCETVRPASHMELVADATPDNDKGAAFYVKREYFCSKECAMKLMRDGDRYEE